MAHKLSKPEARAHARVMDLIHSDRTLSNDERQFIVENYQESASQLNSLVGAFFTPPALARDFAIEVSGRRVLDLCAGIGNLAFACEHRAHEIVCIESCADYVSAGRRVMPQAHWIEADVFDLDLSKLGLFDCVIANPPFGRVPAEGFQGRYTGSDFEYRVIELASHCASHGVFLLPQGSAPFKLSGQPYYCSTNNAKARQFTQQTGIELLPNCGIDTEQFRTHWHGVSPVCEIVCCEFEPDLERARPCRSGGMAAPAADHGPSQAAAAAARDTNKHACGDEQFDLFADA
jgi:SAM-dependent methyltransferase